MLFDVVADEHQCYTILRVTGDLDVATAPRLRQEAVRVTSGGARHLVIDLSGVDFLDSTGLGVVVGVLKRVRGLGGSLQVVVTERRVRKVFEITRLDEILDLRDTLDDVVVEGPSNG